MGWSCRHLVRSPSRGCWAWVVAMLWVLVSSAHGQNSHGQCSGVMRRALLLPPISPQLLARIEGQTHDLCWQLVLVNEVPDGTLGTDQRAWAMREASAHDATVVFWILEDAESVRLSVYQTGHAETTERIFPSDVADSSAQMEVIAIATRSTLQVIAELEPPERKVEQDSVQGGAAESRRGPLELTGRVKPMAQRDTVAVGAGHGTKPGPGTADNGSSTAAMMAQERQSSDAAGSSASSSPKLQLAAGIFGVADGVTAYGLWGAWLAPRLVLPRAWLSLRLEHTLEGRVSDESLTLGLTRRGAWLCVGVPFEMAGGVVLSPAAGLGYLQHVRHTRQVSETLSATAAAWTDGVALEGGLSMDVPLMTLPGVRLAATLALVGQWLLAAPVLRYETEGTLVEHRFWHVAPIGYMGIVLR